MSLSDLSFKLLNRWKSETAREQCFCVYAWLLAKFKSASDAFYSTWIVRLVVIILWMFDMNAFFSSLLSEKSRRLCTTYRGKAGYSEHTNPALSSIDTSKKYVCLWKSRKKAYSSPGGVYQQFNQEIHHDLKVHIRLEVYPCLSNFASLNLSSGLVFSMLHFVAYMFPSLSCRFYGKI